MFYPHLLVRRVMSSATIRGAIRRLIELTSRRIATLRSTLINVGSGLLCRILLVGVVNRFRRLLRVIRLEAIIIHVNGHGLRGRSTRTHFLRMEYRARNVFEGRSV